MENSIIVNDNHYKEEEKVILDSLFENEDFRKSFLEILKSKRNLLLFSFDENNYKELNI